MPQTMFERYGGFAQVSRIVSGFYDKMLDSPTTSPYFTNIDMRRLIDHQTKFIAYLMGGPASYSNDQLERVHAHLDITDAAFEDALKMLRETLEDSGVTSEDIRAIIHEMTDRRSLIVTKH